MANRTVYEYDLTVLLPAELWEGAPKNVGLRDLTAEQELLAMKKAENDSMRYAVEATKLAVCEADGKSLSVDDVDALWHAATQQVRTLFINAYAENSVPAKAGAQAFMKSRRVKVG